MNSGSLESSSRSTTGPASQSLALVSQRIVSVDFYSSPPNYLLDPVKNDFNNAEGHWVPVIRIFGATPAGQKTCAHIHGVFPYLYILAEGIGDPEMLASLLDEQINRDSGKQTSASIKHVVRVTPVKGRNYYGYHHSEDMFLKIYFYTPYAVTKAAQILANGGVNGRKFQPFESHIPYILQFFIDYNLFGMNLVHYKHVLFRRKESSKSRPSVAQENCWDYNQIGEELFLPESVKRMTKCELEFDVLADDILNQLEKDRSANPGINAIWKDESERMKNNPHYDLSHLEPPASEDRLCKDDIFDAELLYRRTLLSKLKPFYYKAMSSQESMENSLPPELPYLSQTTSFLPQPEREVSFAVKSASQEIESEENIINFLEEMANSCPPCSDNPEDIFDEEDGEEDGNDGEQEQEGQDNVVWSQSFSTNFEDFCDVIPIASKSGAARTDPVQLGKPEERESRREWNDEILESFMIRMVVDDGNELIQLEDVEMETDEAENSSCISQVVDADVRSSHGKAKKLTQAQKLFRNELLTMDMFMKAANEDENGQPCELPPNHQDQLGDAEIQKQCDSVESLVKPKSSIESNESRGTDAIVKPLKVLEARLGVDAAIQSVPPTRDFEIQSSPLSIPVHTQTHPVLSGKSVSTITETRTVSQDTQTDAGTLDVVRTCGCRCNCGLQYMIDLRSKWEMAAKTRDYATQTDNQAKPRIELPVKRRLLPPEGPPASKKSLVSDDSSRDTKADPSFFKNRAPENRLPQRVPKLPQKNFEQKLVKQQKGNEQELLAKQQWDPSVANPAKFSPQFAAVTKRLEKQKNQDFVLNRKPSRPVIPVSPREVDMSITKVLEYESPDSSEQKHQRLKAARQGLRLFQLKHRQMMNSQKDNARKRKERKELRDVVTEAKRSLKEIVRPLKKTQQDSFINELVRQDEKTALPDSPDYYANNLEHNCEEGVMIDDVNDSRYKRDEILCAEEKSRGNDSEQGPRLSAKNVVNTNLQNTKSVSVFSEHSPRSILKIRNSAGRSPNTRKCIRWGLKSHGKASPYKQKIINGTGPKKELQDEQNTSYNYLADRSEIDGPSPVNPFNAYFNSSGMNSVTTVKEHQYLTTMIVEVFCGNAQARIHEIDDISVSNSTTADNNNVPDPMTDDIVAIFYGLHEDDPNQSGLQTGMLAVDPTCCEVNCVFHHSWPSLKVTYFQDEISMMTAFFDLVETLDPDILTGYEVKNMSWGYIIERGSYMGLRPINLLSRLVLPMKQGEPKNDWDETIKGRIILNIWRLLRHEMAVQSYTFESAMFHILHEKVGLLSHLTLNKYWLSAGSRHHTLNYFCRRIRGVMEIIDKLDLINRTSEHARLYGIQFVEVLSRGSQFRVESMMIRLVKAANMLAASPSIQQRALMHAPMELPLIMEPISSYYTDPVAVLDFQSLYPSIMIAYNYDFGTCLGRVENLGREAKFNFGCLDLEVSPIQLSRMVSRNDVHISPTGVAFVKSNVKRGILPEMLQQILDCRLMVKRSMKIHGTGNNSLHRILDARQLGLKLIANVTYGYTSANFSGRMPCVEVADSVVSKGRETLERAIRLVEENESTWGAKVVYGDTDSMFLLFPGKTRQNAFQIAQEIADEVTRQNPKPVKLKLEKIYQPCILQTKKRYVGFSYENPKQDVPKYDAKGIETVRRDGCPAVAKILEKALRILFSTNDIIQLREYIMGQFRKILLGDVSLCDFTFAREYRGSSGYKPGAVVPALTIAERLRAENNRSEPQPKERVPYVVIFGELNQALIDQTRTPYEFVQNDNLRINSVYYIERVIIPPLNRCFSLAGIDIQKWYAELPRKHLRAIPKNSRARGIMDYFLVSKDCIVCDQKTEQKLLCSHCTGSKFAFAKLQNEINLLNKKMSDVSQCCEYCGKGVCISLDCGTWQKLLRYERLLQTKKDVFKYALEEFPTWH